MGDWIDNCGKASEIEEVYDGSWGGVPSLYPCALPFCPSVAVFLHGMLGLKIVLITRKSGCLTLAIFVVLKSPGA